MAARAQVLVARQRELMGRTASAISATRRGVADLDKVNVFAGAERAAPPVYLDLRA
jgi:C4-dicarboxylate transporter